MILTNGENLRISSDTQNITLVERVIDDVCEAYKVNEDRYGNILIAVTEAVNNAIKHENNNNPEKSVPITKNVDQKQITFFLSNEVKGFDNKNFPTPKPPKNLKRKNE